MKTEFKDVCYLYVGCSIQFINRTEDPFEKQTGILMGPEPQEPDKVQIWYEEELNLYRRCRLDEIKPIFRPLSDITKYEVADMYQLIFKRPAPISFQLKNYAANETSAERVVSHSGVERVGVEFNGRIWADSDLHPYYFNTHRITAYLLSKHFDLFSLIPNGHAIDATTLNK